jgi:hypothetical protein
MVFATVIFRFFGVSGERSRSLPAEKIFCPAQGVGSGDHDDPAAGQTFQPKIGADAEHLPEVAAAGMLFFHPQTVADVNSRIRFHALPPS